MKKDIVLVANYWHFESEKSSSRYRSFAEILCKRYNLEVITSTFCHLKKLQRNETELGLENLPYKVTLEYEKGYKENISIQRIRSYTEFGRNVLEYLEQRKNPDLIIISVPSLAVADYASLYAKRNNVPIIVDIQDLWPEAFRMAFNFPIISDIVFAPMMRQANRIYSRADVLMAVSDTYIKRGKLINQDADELKIYIGTDNTLIEEKIRSIEVTKDKSKFVIAYVGALGHSYDIKGVIDAIKILEDRGVPNIEFKVMGDGVCRMEFERYAQRKKIKCEFTGLLEYGLMMKTLMQCDIAINPIVKKSVASIINKVSDYAAAGIPVVNTQSNEEYKSLLERYRAGINVNNGDTEGLANAIFMYYSDENLRKQTGRNARTMYEKCFDRSRIYPQIIEKIEKLTSGKMNE